MLLVSRLVCNVRKGLAVRVDGEGVSWEGCLWIGRRSGAGVRTTSTQLIPHWYRKLELQGTIVRCQRAAFWVKVFDCGPSLTRISLPASPPSQSHDPFSSPLDPLFCLPKSSILAELTASGAVGPQHTE